jgi:hypothetical protein
LDLKGRKTDHGENCIMVNFMACICLQNNFWVIKPRRMRWARHVARMGEGKNVYGVLVERSEGKRPLGSPRRIWKDIIIMDVGEIGINEANWIRLAQDRVRWRAHVNT